MSEYEVFSRYIIRSVNHIFKNFLDDGAIQEVYETQASEEDPKVAVEFDGSFNGEIIIHLPQSTLDSLTKKFINRSDKKSIRKSHSDVAGEIANLITGTFANQLQYNEIELHLYPPSFNDDPISIKALYENINLSFDSNYGGFDIDCYYKLYED